MTDPTGTGEHPCPDCGALVTWDYTRHTWPSARDGGRRIFMACSGCDSATLFCCIADECRWMYEANLNPDNPRAAANEQRRPPWYPQGADHETVRAAIPSVFDRGN